MTETPQSTTVHVYQSPSNGLGTAAGICSILGMVSCGFLCPIGLILGLCSMSKEPKGMAITGVIVGAIGSIGYLIIFLVFGAAIFAMCGGCLGLAAVGNAVQQQIAAEPAADAIIAYYEANGQLPDDAHAATAIAPFTHEGHGFEYTASTTSQTLFFLDHPGPDGLWDTADDWQTSWDAVFDNGTMPGSADTPAIPDAGDASSPETTLEGLPGSPEDSDE